MNIDTVALEEILEFHGDLLTENQEEALKGAIAAANAPSRGVVDEDVVMQAERAFWPAYNEALRVHGTKADCHAIGMRAALQAATPARDQPEGER